MSSGADKIRAIRNHVHRPAEHDPDDDNQIPPSARSQLLSASQGSGVVPHWCDSHINIGFGPQSDTTRTPPPSIGARRLSNAALGASGGAYFGIMSGTIVGVLGNVLFPSLGSRFTTFAVIIGAVIGAVVGAIVLARGVKDE